MHRRDAPLLRILSKNQTVYRGPIRSPISSFPDEAMMRRELAYGIGVGRIAGQ